MYGLLFQKIVHEHFTHLLGMENEVQTDKHMENGSKQNKIHTQSHIYTLNTGHNQVRVRLKDSV